MLLFALGSHLNAQIPDGAWLGGNANNDWNSTANWQGGIPTTSSTLFFDSGTVNLSSGNASSNIAVSGVNNTSNSAINLSGASTWTNQNDFTLGASGTSRLNLGASSQLNVNQSLIIGGNRLFTYGSGSPGTGIVTMSGNSVLNIASYLSVGDLNNGSITLNDSARLTTNTSASGVTFIAFGTNARGSLTLNNQSAWINQGNVFVGANTGASGTFSIGSGAQFSQSGGDVVLGSDTGAQGQATVAGNWSQSDHAIVVGDAGTGILNLSGSIINGGFAHIGGTTGGKGSVTISNQGYWQNGGDLTVGQYGNGTLTFKDSGSAQNNFGWVGYGSNSAGSVIVSDNGYWQNNQHLVIGYEGSGTLTVKGSGSVSSQVGWIGSNLGSKGNVTLQDNAAWNSGTILYVGYEGSGSLTMYGNSQINDLYGYIAGGTGGTGSATVGGNAVWTSTSVLDVGYRGNGILHITGYGTVNSGRAYIGGNNEDLTTPSGTGFVLVDGHATWNSGTGNLRIGDNGNGRLTVTDNAFVNNANGYIGYGTNALGNVAISGNANWENSKSLVVGFYGNGTLAISGNATVSDSNGFIAYDTNSSGNVAISGSGFWNHSGGISIGHYGNGSLTLSDSGSISTNGEGYIGNGANSEGSATVSGSSLWYNSGTLNIGNSGTGTLTLRDKGTVNALTTSIGTFSNGSGIVNLDGGVLQTATIIKGNGNATLNLNGGTLRANGDSDDFLSNLDDADIVLKNNGVIFDTQGFAVSATNVFNNSAATFTKTGSGTLNLTKDLRTNLYNQQGTINLPNLIGNLTTDANTQTYVANGIQGKVVNRGFTTVGSTVLSEGNGSISAIIAPNGETVASNGNQGLNVTSANGAVVYGATLNLIGNTSYQGTLTFNNVISSAGTLAFNSGNAINGGPLTISGNPAFSGTAQFAGGLVLVSTGTTGNNLNWNVLYTGTDSLWVTTGTDSQSSENTNSQPLLFSRTLLQAVSLNPGDIVGDVENQGVLIAGHITGEVNNEYTLIADKVTGNLTNAAGATTTLTEQEGDVNNAGLFNINNISGNTVNSGTINLRGTADGLHNFGNLENNGLVDFNGISNKLAVNNLSGNGVYKMNVDIANGTGNQLTVNGDANGQHRFLLANSEAPVTGEETVTLVTVAGANNATFSGGIDSGAFRYSVTTTDGGSNVVLGKSVETPLSSAAALGAGVTGAQSMFWTKQQDDVNKRMGELHFMKNNANGKSISDNWIDNIWVRSYGEQANVDSSATGAAMRVLQWGVDLGTDHTWSIDANNQLSLGLFAGYGESNQDLRDYNGSNGKSNAINAGLYATWLHSDGWFADATVKGAHFDNNFNAIDDSFYNSAADYENWGIGAGLEFGKKIEFTNDGWFVEPTLQFSYLHLLNSDYNTTGANVVHVEQDDADIYQFRLGTRIGKSFKLQNGGALVPYAKVAGVEQLSNGNRMSIGTWNERPNLDGARAEVGCGLSWQIDANNQLHLDYEAAFGDKYDKPWGVNAGYRYQF